MTRWMWRVVVVAGGAVLLMGGGTPVAIAMGGLVSTAGAIDLAANLRSSCR